jgi:hypothetical protein
MLRISKIVSSLLVRGGLCVAIPTLSLALMSGSATSDEMITQTGMFVFRNITGDAYHPFYPPVDVTFLQEFGGTPAVSITFPHIGHCFQHAPWGTMTASNITTAGFTAAANGCFQPEATWTATGPKLNWGTVVPAYLVLTVVYSPPGSASGHGSSVTYEADSTTGTTTSASTTFKSGTSSSFDVSGKVYGVGSGSGTGFEASHSVSYSDSMDIKKTTNSTIALTGPSKDEIDHDEDQIWLLLKPNIKLGLSSFVTRWMLADTKYPIQPVLAGQLNGHKPMPDGVAKWLNWAGITPKDYPCILARDPLATQADGITAKDYPCIGTSQAGAKSPFDSGRFAPLDKTFAYVPLDDSGASSEQGYKISNSQTRTITTAVEDSYTVKISESPIDASIFGYFSAKANDTSSWGWTNKSTSGTANGKSQSAQLILRMPSSAYKGSTVMDVYFDTVYNTFAFVIRQIDTSNVGLQGQLLTKAGRQAVYKQVSLIFGRRTYTTLTNSKGEFAFYGDMSGSVVLQAAGVDQRIPEIQATRSITLHAK